MIPPPPPKKRSKLPPPPPERKRRIPVGPIHERWPACMYRVDGSGPWMEGHVWEESPQWVDAEYLKDLAQRIPSVEGIKLGPHYTVVGVHGYRVLWGGDIEIGGEPLYRPPSRPAPPPPKKRLRKKCPPPPPRK